MQVSFWTRFSVAFPRHESSSTASIYPLFLNKRYELWSSANVDLLHKTKAILSIWSTLRFLTYFRINTSFLFEIFNYTGENTQTGINDNGVYDYFTFRNTSKDKNSKINSTVDADGFGDNRAYVEPKLVNNYPVFDCKTKGACTNNFSLGYLFGEQTNPAGEATKGVTGYNPTNTLLQNETIEGVKYYYYDSKRNAVDYDIYSNTFNVRNYLERSYTLSGQENESLRYDFLPFTYLNTTTTKTHPTTGFSYNYEQEEIDHWYGMTMEFDFYMPKNGQINNQDMI